MKLVKSLLLGSAAAVAAAAGAQAADLPSMKSAPVQYVQICDAYGAGFFYIPGTDVCLKIGGVMRAEYHYQSDGNLLSLSQSYKQVANTTVAFTPVTLATPVIAATNSAYTQAYEGRGSSSTVGTYMRTYISLDARDQTAYGTLRTFLYFSLINYGSVASAAATINNGIGSPTSATTGFFTNSAATSPSISDGIVQFAGFTFGRANGLETFYRNGNTIAGELAESGNTVNMLAYTATFGQGFSASLELSDPAGHDVGVSGLDQNIQNYATGTPGGIVPGLGLGGHQGLTIAEGGEKLPDLAAVLRVDQGWGSAQIAGMLHQVSTTAIAGTGIAGVAPVGGTTPSTATPGVFTAAQGKTELGYGIIGGVEFNLPQLAAGDQLWLEAAYANGALDYAGVNTGDNGNLSTNNELGDEPMVNGFQRYDRDAIGVENATGTGYILEKEQAWSAFADLLHHWTPQWYSNLYGGYVSVTPGAITRNTDWTEGGLGKGNEWKLGGNLIWSPVSGFYIGLDVMYTSLHQTLAGNAGFAPTALPAGIAQNPSAWQATLRVNRSF